MTDRSVDVIAALQEELEGHINNVSELNGKSIYIYDPTQLSTNQQRLALPAVIYHYAGMRRVGDKHDVYFDLYLLGKAESLTQIKRSRTQLPTTTILQKLRKEIACNTSATRRDWRLENELPNFGVDDKLVYRQRWVTSYQIIR